MSSRVFSPFDRRFDGVRPNWLAYAVVVISFLGVVPKAAAIDPAEREAQFKSQILPILKSVCYDCHTGSEADAGLSISYFETFRSVLKERKTWEKIITRVRIGDMPPPDGPELSDEDRKKLVDWLNEAIYEVDCGKTPNPGAVTLRRLNRSEYRNTIRDLLGIDYAPASDFPGDDVGYGFDNIGDVLTLPPLLMEKYLTAAEQISQRAIVAPEPGAAFEASYRGEQLTTEGGVHKNDGKALFSSQGKLTLTEQAPWPGNYFLEITAGASQAGNEPAKMLISLDGKKVREIAVPATEEDPKVYRIPLRLRGGKRTMTIEFTNDYYVEAQGGKPAQDRNLAIFHISLLGQQPAEKVDESTLPPSHKAIMIAQPSASMSAQEAAQKVLQPLMSRAYRRPASKEEIAKLSEFVAQLHEDGESFEGAIQIALQAVLVSPHFLFKVERPVEKSLDAFPRVSEFELATRLSYFLWSTMPDDRLLQLALKKELSKPEVLRAEVKRMIADKRANAFVENFAGQWLTLRKLDLFEPNRNLFPVWNDSMKDLLRRETYTFFAGVMREDLSILTLLDGDFTYLNEDLAKFYGVSGVEGKEFRKVSMKGKPRAGLTTHASILAVTSNPTRTSPVKRGKWILDNLLGTPPPPAPAGVPELEKSELSGTLRERLEQHRSNPACAGCHKQMDPLGFALENYDAIGRWRTEEQGQKIESSGELPDGTKVRHAGDLIKVLREKHADEFARCLTEKMMTFATGRGMEYFDRCAVDKICSQLKQENYRFSTLVSEIVLSDPFQKRGEREEP